MRSIDEAKPADKVVIVRCDFDDPVLKAKLVEDVRIRRNLPTLQYLLKKNSNLFLISKLGRPKGKDPNLSLRIVMDTVSRLLGEKILFKADLTKGKLPRVTLLENLRFWPQEEDTDLEFSKQIAAFGDLYVNECFATSHRDDASIVGIPKFLPPYAGVNLVKEVEELQKILESPARPLTAIIAGAKLETKLPVIYNLARVADTVLVGGKLMFQADRAMLPENVLIAHDDVDGKDIGPKAISLFREEINKAKTVVWNGTLGMYEEDRYMNGTAAVGRAVVESQAYCVIGGGDTIAALNKLSLLDKMSFVSTGGGAMLEFLAGKKLPGLAALGYYE